MRGVILFDPDHQCECPKVQDSSPGVIWLCACGIFWVKESAWNWNRITLKQAQAKVPGLTDDYYWHMRILSSLEELVREQDRTTKAVHSTHRGESHFI